jgi:hypothetical protein
MVGDNDACSAEIVVEASLKDASDDLISHHAIVWNVYAAWKDFESSRPPGRAEGRLFVHGPVAIVFSLAAVLPESVKFIAYDRHAAK